MKQLCLFTNEFPYGSWEAYLETEVKYYSKFDKIYIYSLQLRKEHSIKIRDIDCNAFVFPIYYASKIKYFLYSFVSLFDKNLYIELKNLINNNRFNFSRLVQLFVFVSRSHYEANKITKNFSKEDLVNSVLYSYRFEYQPYVAYLVKKKLGINSKIICRAHRFDLYEEKRPTGYIPMREILLSFIDKVYPCSNDGSEYLKNKFPNYKDKIETKFLGTIDYGTQDYNESDILRLVSCSNVVSVKRLDLIVESLSLITNKEIEWTHYGNGPEMEKIKNISNKVGNNIKINFMGNVSNQDLMKEYKNNVYDWFINVSTSEGIPVSIMEAMSFGIPCIATDVGGTSEIVEDKKNGVLLPSNIDEFRLASIINNITKMDKRKYFNLRKNSRIKWNEKYNADTNYKKFVNDLLVVGDF
ncbi:colanic acid biosynthesis glycosyltransferase WcaL [Anaerococcus prevotii]|uniref:Glycosyl transferase group 1 n=1 Tax=Anaerococcus prevotii (strain ATCC 9321 / DSM 20548 / JCM 6508 / NCTC 11806 / PC1) TaxID=525919 RepID=C7RDM7_ANAPD|nr:glycosyltransferase [Anaerococcus prevotii]ACV29290.1 glycosyl transferase group 1 [Anaerococcus prevotii DSM 20548]SUU94964.1 colanic acid biosynthesis glycosyltransferase WcaL [Anaerococcus prevotii]